MFEYLNTHNFLADEIIREKIKKDWQTNMSIDLSSYNSSISSILTRHSTSSTKKENTNETANVNEQIRNYANDMMSTRKGLADYMNSKSDSFENLSSLKSSQNLLSAVSKMKNTTNMSSIEKYKYMMEQAQNSDKINTSEPNAEKLLSQSEQIIQKALIQGLSEADTANLSQALNAKRVALSRLDMLG